VKVEAITNREDPGQPILRIMQGDPAYDAVHFVASRQEQFREIRTVLARDARD
jgi:hypothetical protein